METAPGGVAPVEPNSPAPGPGGTQGAPRRSWVDLSQITVGWVDGVLGLLRRLLPAALYARWAALTAAVGQLALFVAAAWTVLFAIIFAAKMDSFAIFLEGLAGAVALLIAQYTAVKFMDAAQVLTAATPTELATPAYADCVALLAVIGGVVAVIAGIVGALQVENLDLLWIGLVIGLWLVGGLAWISLHPRLANITITQGTSAAQEAIAVVGYGVKVILTAVPLIFGIGVTISTLALILAVRAFPQNSGGWPMVLTLSGAAYTAILLFALAPFLVYLGFLIVYLVLDWINTILRACHKYLV